LPLPWRIGIPNADVPIAQDALVSSAALDAQVAPLVTIGANYAG
jgi:hypothetical protein